MKPGEQDRLERLLGTANTSGMAETLAEFFQVLVAAGMTASQAFTLTHELHTNICNSVFAPPDEERRY